MFKYFSCSSSNDLYSTDLLVQSSCILMVVGSIPLKIKIITLNSQPVEFGETLIIFE